MRWPIWRERHRFTAPTSACRSHTTASTISSTLCLDCRSSKSWSGLLQVFYHRPDCSPPCSHPKGVVERTLTLVRTNPTGHHCLRMEAVIRIGFPDADSFSPSLTNRAVCSSHISPHFRPAGVREPLKRSCTHAMFTDVTSLR